MNLRPLTDKKETRKAFKLLSQNLTQGCLKLTRFVGWQGGRGKYPVYWNPRLRFWTLLRVRAKDARYWCCFGLKDATKHRAFSITGQVNPTVKGFNRRTGGAFVCDSQGQVYVAHSGKIGGGRSGIGKSAFVAAYRGKNWNTVIWPDKKETEMIVIGRVDGAHLQGQIAHFVSEIDRFKKSAMGRKSPTKSQKQKSTFSLEFMGRRKAYAIHNEIEGECDHGPVISALADALQKRGLRCANDIPRDLYTFSSTGHIQMLFEAKTDLSTASVYCAIGQLMFHAAAEPKEPRRVFVAPGTPTPKTKFALKKLGIEILSYKWDGGRLRFLNLGELLA
ncbi:MAG: hypothetical protein LAN61_04905 [Acidobacteriia bacterium]|nr:hypothetical protein [Terriglobia bacterium]